MGVNVEGRRIHCRIKYSPVQYLWIYFACNLQFFRKKESFLGPLAYFNPFLSFVDLFALDDRDNQYGAGDILFTRPFGSNFPDDGLGAVFPLHHQRLYPGLRDQQDKDEKSDRTELYHDGFPDPSVQFFKKGSLRVFHGVRDYVFSYSLCVYFKSQQGMEIGDRQSVISGLYLSG